MQLIVEDYLRRMLAATNIWYASFCTGFLRTAESTNQLHFPNAITDRSCQTYKPKQLQFRAHPIRTAVLTRICMVLVRAV